MGISSREDTPRASPLIKGWLPTGEVLQGEELVKLCGDLEVGKMLLWDLGVPREPQRWGLALAHAAEPRLALWAGAGVVCFGAS